jgi:hypothetical protein
MGKGGMDINSLSSVRFIYPGKEEVYEGDWKFNKRHGQGVLSKTDGTVIYKG